MADIFAQADEARERGLMLAREKASYLYTLTVDAGDLDTIASVLRQAEQDDELARMIFEINNTLWEEMQQEPQCCAVCGGPLLPLPGSVCPQCDRKERSNHD